jgi:hypothetical protein
MKARIDVGIAAPGVAVSREHRRSTCGFPAALSRSGDRFRDVRSSIYRAVLVGPIYVKARPGSRAASSRR